MKLPNARLTPLLAPLVLVAAAAASPTLVQDQGDFMTAFRAAMKINAKPEMARLVKTRTLEAVDAVALICEGIAESPTDQLEDEIAALRSAWKDAIKTDFVDTEYQYFSLMRPEIKEQRRKLRQRFDLTYQKVNQAEAAKDTTAFGELGMQMKGYGDAFLSLGDLYLASVAYIHAGRCFDQTLAGDHADLRRACEAFKKGAEARKDIGLPDAVYQQTKERADALEAAGYGDPSKGPEARKKSKDEQEAQQAFMVPMSFEVFDDLDGVQRMLYTADDVYQIWPTIFLAGSGSAGKVRSIQDGSPQLKRTGESEALIDSDGDGTPDKDVPLTGKVTVVQLQIGKGEDQRPWAFQETIGLTQDTYQGMRFNMGPGDDALPIYIAPAASMVGKVQDTEIRVLDDNLDGVYGSLPLEWAEIGTLDGSFQRDMDSIVIAGSKHAQPWSEVVQIGDAWYKLEPEHGGKELKVTPTTLETGKVRLDMKGAKARWVVLRGDTRDNQNDFFEISQGGHGGVDVPVGRYQLYVGEIAEGQRNQTTKALILPGSNMPGYEVESGGTTTVELGGPFALDFKVEQTDEKAKVVGNSVVVIGRGGETYQRLWNCVVQPEVQSRPEGKKKSDKEGRMRSAESQEQVAQDFKGDYSTVWFPLDFEFDKKGPDKVQVQLTEKKNKLFGKLESDWKE